MARLNSSIIETDEINQAIEAIRKHYSNAIKRHLVLATATIIGLAVLAKHPEKLTSTTIKK